MSQIRHVEIKNFRVVKHLVWTPNPGLNCLIGAGDSGKSTILEAIDLALGARRSYSFSDADFNGLNTDTPIEIFVTIGLLAPDLLNYEKYGKFLRAFDLQNKLLHDEPANGCETVITIRLVVDKDLNPDWLLYSDRALAEDIERRLPWKHRELISPARLGTISSHHLGWSNRSVLNKLSEDSIDVSDTLTRLGRATRDSFREQKIDGIDEILTKVKTIANKLGVSVEQLEAQLDVGSISFSNGAISLHGDNNTPLKQLGTGSSRLLISGLQKESSSSNILIIDEAEYGLEPFRITRLLNELGSKDAEPQQQVFITTHSPYVLRELQAQQLFVVRKLQAPLPPPNPSYSHIIYSLTNSYEDQSTLRVCAEAFFSKVVIVCEGKTEIGLVKGIDLYSQSLGRDSIQAQGVFCTDGGGDSMFTRALVFKKLGYHTVILKDSDKDAEHQQHVQTCINNGIGIFSWGNNFATENALFSCCPSTCIPLLLNYAVSLKGEQSINQHISDLSQNSYNLQTALITDTPDLRVILGNAAKKKGWFKDIEPAEYISRSIIGPHYDQFLAQFTAPINQLFHNVRNSQG
ncbi:ATP-dependent nuclease [Aliiglaciecola lipolytica]|uniref:ATP-dependent nuclease n=1 Tax=Aliiglaciecola lipolytica TaxID=477689 RepID=UPI001C09D128|nr:ATP-binding protein [Aliiglaciecola lipolytica]MBU2877483.1 ATP-binding protein [Aliiglaciecola lipolytica]